MPCRAYNTIYPAGAMLEIKNIYRSYKHSHETRRLELRNEVEVQRYKVALSEVEAVMLLAHSAGTIRT